MISCFTLALPSATEKRKRIVALLRCGLQPASTLLEKTHPASALRTASSMAGSAGDDWRLITVPAPAASTPSSTVTSAATPRSNSPAGNDGIFIRRTLIPGLSCGSRYSVMISTGRAGSLNCCARAALHAKVDKSVMATAKKAAEAPDCLRVGPRALGIFIEGVHHDVVMPPFWLIFGPGTKREKAGRRTPCPFGLQPLQTWPGYFIGCATCCKDFLRLRTSGWPLLTA